MPAIDSCEGEAGTDVTVGVGRGEGGREIRLKWPTDLGCACEREQIQQEGGAGVQGQLCNHSMV